MVLLSPTADSLRRQEQVPTRPRCSQKWPHDCATDGAGRPATMRVSTALGCRSMVRMGPVIRATEDPPRTPPTSRHLTSPLTVLRELRRCRLAWRLPPTRSHGGSQGFKSPHLHPQTPQVRASPASSRRRSLHAAAAPQPHADVAVQPRRLAVTRRLGPRPPTMTTERSRHLATHPSSP